MIEKISKIFTRYAELETLLGSAEVAASRQKMEDLGREYSNIGKNMAAFREYYSLVKAIADAREILQAESDQDLLQMAKEEVDLGEARLPELEQKVRLLLVPRDPTDSKNAIVEIRAGTGGVEAGIFGADLYRMYTHFIQAKGWKLEVLNFSDGDLGGFKEVVFMVSGEDAYGTFKFESGVHRVQRVPETEAQGRIHTSAASVAVFPEADEVEFSVDPEELRIDVFRAGGKGGQHVNKTESAVRIVHLPSGITVSCQDEKSQHKNKAKAMKILQSRLFDAMERKKHAEESASRKSMVGSGDRSEKIRTYNFPQNRVTDHRISLTLYKLEAFMNGDLTEMINALAMAEVNERVKAD